MKPTSLVTGGAGFLGSHVARHLLESGHRVIVLDDLSGGFIENVPAGAEFVPGSTTDPVTVADVFDEYRIDYVFHLAAYAAEGLSHHIRRYNYENNVLGSVTLINEAIRHEVECFVFTSSAAVYGEPTGAPFTEDSPCRPIDPYGAAKLAVEHDLAAARRHFGLDSIIFRPHNVYGEHQNIWDRYRNVVGIFMRQIMEGEPLTIFGDGEQTRAFSYVGDVAPVIARSVDSPAAPNRTFNIGAGEAVTVNDLAHAVMRAMGVDDDYPVRHLPERDEAKHVHADHDLMWRTFLGPGGAQSSLRDGLARMAEWANSVEPRESRRPCAIEVDRNLPEAWRSLP